MATIDQFKAQLIGGGPRANRFRVFIPRSGAKIEFLCQLGLNYFFVVNVHSHLQMEIMLE